MDFGDLKVVIVDDEAYTRRIVRRLLRKIGITNVYEAGDGGEGLQVITAMVPDIVVCDIHMEPADGLTLLWRIRESEKSTGKRLPFLFLTSDANEEIVFKARNLDVDGYLVKPVSVTALQTRIQAVIDPS